MTVIKKVENFEVDGVEYELRFYPNSHQYKIKGGKWEKFTNLPSVTKVVKPASTFTSRKAIGYACKHIRLALEDRVGQTLQHGDISPIIGAVNSHRDNAADRGTLIHDWAEGYFEGNSPTIPVGHEIACEAIKEWADAWQITPLLTEQIVAHVQEGYSGMLDLYAAYVDPDDPGAVIRDGIFDFKTGNYWHAENFLQLSGYAEALEAMQRPISKENRFILHLPPGAAEVKVVRPRQTHAEDWLAFTAAHLIHTWQTTVERAA